MQVPVQAPAVAPRQRGRRVGHRATTGAAGVRPSQYDGEGTEEEEDASEDGGDQAEEGNASLESD